MNDATHHGPSTITISSIVFAVRPQLLLETRLLIETRLVLEQCSQTPGLYMRPGFY